MRKIPMIFGLLLYAGSLFSQKDMPKFGKVDKAEFSSLQCSYDPDAEAELLVNAASMQYQVAMTNVSTEVEYRVRIKILKEKAVDRGNITIPYYRAGSGEKISKIEGYTYNVDQTGNVVATKLEKSAIYDKQVDRRYAEIIFSMPAVKVGSIIEYRFLKFSQGFSVNSWVFQDDIPTRLSAYNMQLPRILKFEERFSTYLPIEKDDHETVTDITRSYVMRNIPAVRMEPYTSSMKDYMQKLDFSLVGIDIPGEIYQPVRTNWRTIGENLLEDSDFGAQLNKNLDIPDALANDLKGKSAYQKMVSIHRHVRESMTWNKEHSIWAMDGIKKNWQSRSGNSGEINMILISLLKQAKVEVYPIMVSTRDNGRINTFFPSMYHFNSVMAYVQIDSSFYILDASDKYSPAHLIPHSVANTDGLVIRNKEEVHWVTMNPNKQRYQVNVFVLADVSPDGKISGEANINSFGYSRAYRLKSWSSDKDKFSEKYFGHVAPEIKIDDVSVKNSDNDSLPLEQHVKFNLPTTNTGDYNYFSPSLFLGLDNNEFISETRITDIDFGYNQSYTMVGSFNLPEDYIVEELPKNKRMVLPDKSVSMLRIIEFVDHKINIRINVEFSQPVYGLDGYADFQAFHKLLFDTLNEQVVIHKKKA
ncbi:MAG TPA: DUF3857 domain-containing protein [Flavitalea sp.]|nr:DUF3857 domain-containing protein [Flavitalea sp.]